MTYHTHVLQAKTNDFSSFERAEINRRDLNPDDVLIKIAYCGICHSDIDAVAQGFAPFPIIPGHEITGQVLEIGSAVTHFKVGDRVGVGCFVDSCGQCDFCQAGQEQFCRQEPTVVFASPDTYGNFTQGGYADKIVVKEHFVLHIPDQLPLDVASPLLCAGITTYNPLKRFEVGSGKRVAILGLGGLGHIAVQFAHQMGRK